jgi:hypothetical protein
MPIIDGADEGARERVVGFDHGFVYYYAHKPED